MVMKYYTDTDLRVCALNAVIAVSQKEDGIQSLLVYTQYAFEYLKTDKVTIEKEKSN